MVLWERVVRIGHVGTDRLRESRLEIGEGVLDEFDVVVGESEMESGESSRVPFFRNSSMIE
jgi:hypothetical protein